MAEARYIEAGSDFLTSAEVAQKLRFTVRGVNKMAAEGRLPGAAKVGRCWRFDRYKLAVYLKAQERRPIGWHPSTKGARPGGRARKEMASSSDGHLEQLLGIKL